MTTSPLRTRLIFLGLVGLIFAWVAWDSASFPGRARIFPQTVALLGLTVIIVKFVLLLIRDDAEEFLPVGEDEEAGAVTTIGEEWRRALPFLSAFAAYGLGIAVIGFLSASSVFILLFLRRFNGMGWLRAGGNAVAFTLILALLSHMIGLELPTGVLGLLV